jgi:hypothetical protein
LKLGNKLFFNFLNTDFLYEIKSTVDAIYPCLFNLVPIFVSFKALNAIFTIFHVHNDLGSLSILVLRDWWIIVHRMVLGSGDLASHWKARLWSFVDVSDGESTSLS